jgi:hypothetical protein
VLIAVVVVFAVAVGVIVLTTPCHQHLSQLSASSLSPLVNLYDLLLLSKRCAIKSNLYVVQLSRSYTSQDPAADDWHPADPYTHFLQRKSCWRGKSRYILNCRRMHPCPFTTRSTNSSSSSSSSASADETSSQQQQQQPQQRTTLDAVSELLQQALALQADISGSSGGGDSSDTSDSSAACALIEFLDGASHLRWADLSQPGDKAAGDTLTHHCEHSTHALFAVLSLAL